MPIHDLKALLCDNNGKEDHGDRILITWLANTVNGPEYGPHGGWLIGDDGSVTCEHCAGRVGEGQVAMIDVHYTQGIEKTARHGGAGLSAEVHAEGDCEGDSTREPDDGE